MEIDITSGSRIAAALNKLTKSDLRKKKARLREIYDDVMRAKNNSVSEKVIIQTLASEGLHFSRSSFSVTLNRIKNEIERESKSTPAPSSKPTTQTTQIGVPKIQIQQPARQNESAAKSGANPLHALTDRMAAGVPHTKFETE
jgi:hypothetical protein